MQQKQRLADFLFLVVMLKLLRVFGFFLALIINVHGYGIAV
jgi:hypothetical protein